MQSQRFRCYTSNKSATLELHGKKTSVLWLLGKNTYLLVTEREGEERERVGQYTPIYLYIPPYTSIYHYIPTYTFIYLHVLSYGSIHLHIPLYTHINLHIPSYTFIYLQISRIRNTKANMRPKNGHISRPKKFPKVRI